MNNFYWYSLAGLFLIGMMAPAAACSFRPGYAVAPPAFGWTAPKGPRPPEPIASVVSLKRGYDDGNRGSCSDAGILTIGVKPGQDTKGYLLKLIKGKFPDQVEFPDYYIWPIHIKGGLGFFFVWLDWSYRTKSAKPINVLISVTQINWNGRLSKPRILHVVDPGS